MKKNLRYVLIALSLFLLPAFLFGQAPDLGAASNFALFTSAGAFNNTGSSILTGDVGSYTSSPVGLAIFPNPPAPGLVIDGSIYGPAPSPSLATPAQQAAVINAYEQLSLVTCGTTLVLPLAGQILTSGVYCYGAGATLKGELTLDGQGNPDALFIIKIGGAFATTGGSNIKLINSASVCNVYWQISGQFDLIAGSAFKGTIVTEGAINLFDGSSLEGRILSTAGDINIENSVVSIPQAVGTPVFALGATSSRCQEAGTVTYTATAINNNGIYYSLDETTTAFVGNSIVTTTGEVTYAAGWSGTTTITASAAGCDGPTTAIHTVTVFPSSLISAITHQ